MSESGRGPDVPFPPPVLFVGGFLLGVAVDAFVYRLWSPPASAALALNAIGWILASVGLALAVWGRMTFVRIGTAVYPNRDARTLVTGVGPYRFSRNPMYTGLAMLYAGGALLLHSIWALLLLPVVLGFLVSQVIAREERYLAAEFGDSYREYQRRVRRWL